ncbi:MAG: beta-N-acetylhexosaminidase [Paramuribaculum sp.]|nr:beta-N-acetylhexosaminidase [Paramuribaculum sp.]
MRIKPLISLMLGFIAATAVAATTPLVPKPASVTEISGEFRFSSPTTYSVPAYAGDSVAHVFNLLKADLEKGAGTTFTPATGKAEINLTLNPDLGPEAYLLSVNPQGITAAASRPAGFFYALQTLRQLLPFTTQTAPATLPCLEIADAPRFGWRGFMLDEGRHIFGKDEVKKVLDMMAAYKMNRFHWHLTEDQGWRIEIKKYPKLTEVGAQRGSKSLGWRKMEPDTVAYGGFYTQDDIREIVAYAADRFIEVVPEIDIPGHTQAAVAAYPELLACDPENPHEVWLMQGVSPDVMNVANPAAVQMAKDIIDELVPLFPFPYLHLGGDECPTDKWETNAQCVAQLDSIGSTNFRDLQLNFYKQLNDHMATKPESDRRKLIFWNEVLHGNTDMLPSDITIMAWVGADKAALDAAGRGMTTILSPQIPYYINRKQSPLATEPVSQGAGTETLEAVYNYVPLKNVPPNLQDKYLGVQANFWSEYVITPEFLEYLMMPRLAAVAEAAWTPQNLRDYSDFRTRIRAQEPMLRARDWNFAPHEFMNE